MPYKKFWRRYVTGTVKILRATVSSFLPHSHIDSFTRIHNALFFIYHRIFLFKTKYKVFSKKLSQNLFWPAPEMEGVLE